MEYCANCDNIAENIIPDTNTPLCGTCSTAYEWGQNGIPIDLIPQNQVLEPIEEQHT